MTMHILTHFPALRLVSSGGQTGVDRAALDWAIDLGQPHAGWCPRGRKAEDGIIAEHYQLRETESARYEPRTRRNVIDSDATLILNLGALEGGTLLTTNICQRVGKPYLIVQLDAGGGVDEVSRARAWLQANAFATLNLAGPRESKRPGVYQAARQFLALLVGEPTDGLLARRGELSPTANYPVPTERIWHGSGPPPPGVLSTYNPSPPYRLPWLRLVHPAGPNTKPTGKPRNGKGE